MSKLSKVLYLCVILLLGWLAVMPHWPTIKEEAANFYAAWQQIRGSEPLTIDEAQTAGAEEEHIRQRSIAPPKPAVELPAPLANRVTTVEFDPFIREARERAKEDPEAAMQWLQEQSTGTERLRGMLEVVALWAAKDSESALLWLESNAQGIARLETLNSGVEMWAERDPQAAAGWIEGMANDGSKITAAKSLAATWAKSNPLDATDWVSNLPNGAIREEAASALALSLLESDPAGAATWAVKESYQSGDHTLAINIIQNFARLDPNEAETFVRKITETTDFLESSLIDTSYIEGYVEARSENDPLGTAAWIKNLSEEDPFYSTGHANKLMSTWAKTDSIAASAWLSEQPLGEERDAAIVGFAETIQQFEPEAAATWADTISNPDQRTQQLTQTIRTWAREKPQAALKWVINSDLAPAEKEQLASEIGWD